MFTFFSLNVERDKHIKRIVPFLDKTHPDVLCFQEILENDFKQIRQRYSLEGIFAPRTVHEPTGEPEGLAILSRFALIDDSLMVYDQFTKPDPELSHAHKTRTLAALLAVTLQSEETELYISTTHFTWSNQGKVTDEQRVNMRVLLDKIEAFPELVLCGDFNTPRGKALFDMLSEKLIDNVPLTITTTIDPQLHRAGALQYVVDGLFTTPDYKVEKISIEQGLSDHCAIFATISKS